MKRLSVIFVVFAVISTVLFSAAVCLADSQLKATTVAQARMSAEDTSVALTGHVIKKVHENEFLFSDGTGQLLLRVNDDAMLQAADAGREMDVEGVVVINFMYTEVTAYSVTAHD